jgi:hypothetical protein
MSQEQKKKRTSENLQLHILGSIRRVLGRRRFGFNIMSDEIPTIMIDRDGCTYGISCFINNETLVSIIASELKLSERLGVRVRGKTFFYQTFNRDAVMNLRRIGTIIAHMMIQRPVYVVSGD